MTAKVGHFQRGLGFHEIASGSEEYCRGFLDGYNLYSSVDAVLVLDVCQCGHDRVEVIKRGDEIFRDRTGCSRCDRWDGPVRIR